MPNRSGIKRSSSVSEIDDVFNDNDGNDNDNDTANNDTETTKGATQSKSRAKKIKSCLKQNTANNCDAIWRVSASASASNQLSELSQEAIDVINSVAENCNNRVTEEEDDISTLKSRVIEMSVIIDSQANEIKSLNRKIDLIMSLIGIKDSAISSPQQNSATEPAAASNQLESALITNDTAHSIISQNAINDIPADLSHTAETWSDVTRKTNTIIKSKIMNSNLCHSVVSAMYVEQRQKDLRANSFVVSGLPVEHDIDDETKVKRICKQSLNIDIDANVTKVKRIGKPSADKKAQPLLVILKQKDLAQRIINDARLLRQSCSNYIRTNVFINPNLTHAESIAAYQMRCRRRQAKTTQPPITHNNNNNSAMDQSNVYQPANH